MAKNSIPCESCGSNPYKYVCPKCEMLYCSKTCFNSIGHIKCSEEFYHKNVLEELESSNHEFKDPKEILDMLRRTEDLTPELDSDDEEESSDLAYRLAGMDLDDAEKVWSVLNDNERKEFEALVRNGDVSSFLPIWKPWWCYSDENKVQIEDSKKFKEIVKHCPKVNLGNAENELMRKYLKDNPSLQYPNVVVNILASYALVARYFNGDHQSHPKQAAYFISYFSLYLKDPSKIIHSYAESTEQFTIYAYSRYAEEFGADSSCFMTLRDDLLSIIAGPDHFHRTYYILEVLQDIWYIFQKAILDVHEIPKKGSFFYKRFIDAKFVRKLSESQMKEVVELIKMFIEYSKKNYHLILHNTRHLKENYELYKG